MRLHKDLMGASAAPLILSILASGESYGYALIKSVHELSAGHIEWTDGMLYPVLHRLEAQGHIKSQWRISESGRRRKYYSIKAAGRKVLEEQREQWLVVHVALAKLWGIAHV
jgi:PadR family transcriptional regulator, regulatory protein PadR